jgi:16S rRNA pseudouridine516 synthase
MEFGLAKSFVSRANERVTSPRRIDQLLSNLGYCSRREARAWVSNGRVTVGGKEADDSGLKADPGAVRVDGEALDHLEGLLLLLNKPLGLVCSHEEREGPNVYSLLPERWRRRNPQITSVGRLDKDTSGLLLLTDQTALVHKLTSPKHKVPKRYRVTVDQPLREDLSALFAGGSLMLQGEKEPCLPAELQILDPLHADVILVEGRYHQVRRMFASQGYEVQALHRSHFGELNLDGVETGRWRELPLDQFA